MLIDTLMALCPLDGRYRDKVEDLATHMSEFGLFKARVEAQVSYLTALSAHDDVPLREFTNDEVDFLDSIIKNFSPTDAEIIKLIETTGYDGIEATNHDVVAVVEWFKLQLKDRSLEDVIPYVHIASTSEDCNNLAYGLMLRRAVVQVIHPALLQFVAELDRRAKAYSIIAMLARTHGQAATPTTLGKEISVWVKRLERQGRQLVDFQLMVKFNGASGNYCAHMAAFPSVKWESFTQELIRDINELEKSPMLDFEVNTHTTQIEPHETYVELFDIIKRVNNIIIDLCQDFWRYISDDWLVQKAKAGERGSSAMPHKVNPIDFENAEGNLELANAMMECFARKLPRSRLQRDLSDSTVERNFGTALGFSLVAYKAALKGLGKILPNEAKIKEALDAHPEILSEAYQTILRREGVTEGYQLLTDATRGKGVTLEALHELARSAPVSPDVVEELLALTPEKYIGLAPALAMR